MLLTRTEISDPFFLSVRLLTVAARLRGDPRASPVDAAHAGPVLIRVE
jgi:hypothetical protein